jgi:tRNA A-37 threonylcarbamoyl transferase component Bud32
VTTLKDLWKQVHSDLNDLKELGNLLSNLHEAGTIQRVPSMGGFLPLHNLIGNGAGDRFVDFSLLTDEERGMKRKRARPKVALVLFLLHSSHFTLLPLYSSA